jgi:hypothetical protein
VERLTPLADYEGRDKNSNLFGDGAGAFVLKESSDIERGVLGYDSIVDSTNNNQNYIFHSPQGKLRMPFGPRVYNAAVKSMSEITNRMLEFYKWDPAGTLLVPHQANLWLDLSTGHNTNIPLENTLLNVHEYGNMSSATIAILIDCARKQGINLNQWVYMPGLLQMKSDKSIEASQDYDAKATISSDNLEKIVMNRNQNKGKLDFRHVLLYGSDRREKLIKIKEGDRVFGVAFGSGLVAAGVPMVL